MPYFHMSQIPGNEFDIDLDCSSLDPAAKFAVAGDFDGDGQVELAVAIEASDSAGNDFWVMKFDPTAGTWHHLSPTGFADEADLDCSSDNHPARFAVAGDFDGDGQPELAVAIEASGTLGNDFWVMAFSAVSPELMSIYTCTATLFTDNPHVPNPQVSGTISITFLFDRCRKAVKITDFPSIVVPEPPNPPVPTPLGDNRTTITLTGGGTGSFDRLTGNMSMSISLHFAESVNIAFSGDEDSHVTVDLTTGQPPASPNGSFTGAGNPPWDNPPGSPRNPANGAITLVGTSQFTGGFLNGNDCRLIIDGNLVPSL